MSIKEFSNQVTTFMGTVLLTALVSILFGFIFWQLAMRLYYMSVKTPGEAELTSNKNMVIGGLWALFIVVSIAGIIAFANQVLTGIIN